MVYVLALGAAALFGLGSAVQQRAASRAPEGLVLHWRLLWYLVRQRLWLVGVGTAVVGNILSALALGKGGVALVQPLLVTRLLFALPIAATWERRRLTGREWGGAIAISGGLGAFLVAGRPEEGGETDAPIWIWLLIVGLVGLITGGLVKLARRLAPEKEAPVLGIGAGMLFGLQSALTDTAMGRLFDHGLLALLLHWSPYAVAVVAVTGTLLLQSAFRLEPLEASYPPLAAVEPLAGIAIGLGVLGGTVRLAPQWLAIEAVGLLVMTAGVWVLAKAAMAFERSRERDA
ncbi:hypothetical protein GCM10010182_64580 [Actinomadura cremea]|nr:hypothetical protein GCM10010182_64580 [Actinomadura cremea]